MTAKQVFEEVVSGVKELQNLGQTQINICWPTNTCALFMRRRFSNEVFSTLGVRHTTCQELMDLIEDFKSSSPGFNNKNNVSELITLAQISTTLLPKISPWRNISTIRETLRIAYRIPKDKWDFFASNFPLAEKCFSLYEQYQHKEMQLFDSHSDNTECSHILGKCIVVNAYSNDEDIGDFINKFGKYIHKTIEPKFYDFSPQLIDIELHGDPFDEIDAVLFEIINKDFNAGNSAIIVPNEHYRKFVISRAIKFGITLSGLSAKNIGDHEFIQFAKDFLDQESKSKSFSAFFEPIVEKITNRIQEFNLSENEDEKELSQKAFTILKELSNFNEVLEPHEAVYLLEELCSPPLRENKMGNGIYVATPQELFGTSFNEVYVLGMNDNYIPQNNLRSSLINYEQFLELGLSDMLNTKIHGKNLTNWTLCCSENIHISSSEIDITGKDVSLPYWAHAIENEKFVFRISSNESETIFDESYLSRVLDVEPNTSNIGVDSCLPKEISPTAIEVLSHCPAKYFYKYRLYLKSEGEAYDPDSLDNMTAGSKVHELLENYILKNQSIEQLFTSLDEMLEQDLASGILPNIASVRKNKITLSELLNRFLILNRDLNPSESITEFPIENFFELQGNSIKIKGNVDRIDLSSEKHAKIIDYKTGSFEHQPKDNFYQFGQRLQLAIYAFLLSSSYEVDEIQYWYLKENKKPIDEKLINKEEIQSISNIIENILSILLTGLLPAKPISIVDKNGSHIETSPCENCEFDAICYSEYKSMWDVVSQKETLQPFVKTVSEPKGA